MQRLSYDQPLPEDPNRSWDPREAGTVEDRWTETASGRCINVLALNWKPHIPDIAAQSSLICRFGGCCSRHYSVAQHSVYASQLVSPKYRLEALFHDVGEAYLGLDMMRPYKQLFPRLKAAEKAIEAYIAKYFKLRYPWPEEVKRIDNALLMREAEVLMPSAGRGYIVPGSAMLELEIEDMTPREAEMAWLRAFYVAMADRLGGAGVDEE